MNHEEHKEHEEEKVTRSVASLAALTFAYSVALAVIMQAAHTLTRILLAFATASALLDPPEILGELANKIGWAVVACEAVVLFSIFARRRWVALIVIAAVSVFIGGVFGQALRVAASNLLGRASAFIWSAAFDSATLLSLKYIFVGAAVAFASRRVPSAWQRFLGAGFIAALIASVITLTAMSVDLIAKLGNVAVDFVFALGCTTVAWHVHSVAEPLIERHKEIKSELKNI